MARTHTNVRRRGGALLYTALALPMLVLLVGIGVEPGRWYFEQDRLQGAADAAALHAARGVWHGPAAAAARAGASLDDNGMGQTSGVEHTTEIGVWDPLGRTFTPVQSRTPEANAVRVRLAAEMRPVTPIPTGPWDVNATAIARMPGLTLMARTDREEELWQNDRDILEVLGRDFDLPVRLIKGEGAPAEAVAGERLVVISSSCESGTLDPELRDIDSGIVCMERKFYDKLGMAGTAEGHDQGDITRRSLVTDGRIADWYGRGPFQIEERGQEALVGWGRVGPDAEVLATVDGDRGKAAAFEYRPEDRLADGGRARGWRSGVYTRSKEVQAGSFRYNWITWALFNHMLTTVADDARLQPMLVG